MPQASEPGYETTVEIMQVAMTDVNTRRAMLTVKNSRGAETGNPVETTRSDWKNNNVHKAARYDGYVRRHLCSWL